MQRGLRSLETQTSTDFEVIFVDDCSTDNTYTFLQDYCSLSKLNTQLLHTEKNSGPGKAREAGVRAARGEYIAFMDSDDWYETDFVEAISEVLRDSFYDMAFFDFYRIYQSGKRKYIPCTLPLSKTSSLHCYAAMAFESLWGLVIRAGLIKKVRMPALYNSEDAALVPLLISLSSEVTCVPRPFYNYLHREQSLSTSRNKRICQGFIEAFDFLLKNMPLEFTAERNFRGIQLVLYGAVFKALDAEANKKEVKGIIAAFEGKVPHWKSNEYISQLPLRKRLFLRLLRMRCFHLLRLYVALQRAFLLLK